MIPGRVKWATFAIICIAAAFTAFLKINLKLDTSDTIAVAGLIFTILAFTAVLYSLYAVFAQLRKSMAKPKLKVAFTEDGKTETQFIIAKSTDSPQNLYLWVINTGNAITKLFQIDFDLPAIFKPKFTPSTTVGHGIPSVAPKNSSIKGNKIISFCSYEKIYCFVNNPEKIHSLHLEIRPENYEEYPSQFTIKYRIFGDWAETQEGKLQVICNKQ